MIPIRMLEFGLTDKGEVVLSAINVIPPSAVEDDYPRLDGVPLREETAAAMTAALALLSADYTAVRDARQPEQQTAMLVAALAQVVPDHAERSRLLREAADAADAEAMAVASRTDAEAPPAR